MSDDEVESFEITDFDLNNEFNINRSRRPTKDQQIYGVWADSDEEPPDKAPNRRERRKKQKDYSTPIGFVSGGLQQPRKKKDEEEAVDVEDEEVTVVANSSSEDEAVAPAVDLMAGLRRRGPPVPLGSGPGHVGDWERHTKGIGAKLLMKMGYQPGKGLGKGLQGISAPVTATLRKGRGAIGAYGPEVKMKKGEAIKDIGADGEVKEEAEKSNKWRKSHKQRYYYRAAEDVISEGKPAASAHTQHTKALASVPVIDMRGPEKRVLSGYHALRTTAPRYEDLPRRDCPHLALPELLHNLNLLVDMCEQDIIECSRKGQIAEDRAVALERDRNALAESIKQADAEMEVLENICAEVSKLTRPDLSLDDAYKVFNSLQEKHPSECSQLGLGGVGCAGGVLGGPMRAWLANWTALTEPARPLSLLQSWSPLLTAQALQDIFWEPWLEAVTRAAETWEPRNPAPMKALLETWTGIVPPQELRLLLRGALVPRLASAAVAWDPTRDTMPLHHWILPWHELAGTLLEESVYPSLRSRLVGALAAWHPADGSALALLRPWAGAWALALPALARSHILPRLEGCMRAIPVEPDSSPTESWGWCASWEEILGARALAGALSRALLPRWLAALAAWLNRRPPHAHIVSHYSSWKGMFSEKLNREPELADTFRRALDMMNRSMDSPVAPPPPLRPPAPPPAPILSTPVELQHKSFSELLQARASERGLGLVPLPGRSREGRPLYRLGTSLLCYVLRNVVMYSADLGRTYQPVGLEALLQIAASQP